MKIIHLITSLAIVACTAVCWFILGTAMSFRTDYSGADMNNEVAGVWGPEIEQLHPKAWFETPNAPNGKAEILPSKSDVFVKLASDPKKRGLIWHRTYDVDFKAGYVFTNPTKIPQTIYIEFPLPANASGMNGFTLTLDKETDAKESIPGFSGKILKTILLPASESVTLQTSYQTRATNTWKYIFTDKRRISGFNLEMQTDFKEINYPNGTGSPSDRQFTANGCTSLWNYPDILAAPSIGMDMPKQLNAGPVAARIAFFAPVSLLFFVTIILLMGGLKQISIHPMHIFFVSAGFFAFHLLFAYLVDLINIHISFGIAAIASVALVCGYLKAVGGKELFKVALPAQTIYLVVFSASFFIDGLTGITLTVLGVITLALLMFVTAKTDWKTFFTRKTPAPKSPAPSAAPTPPAIPSQASA